MTQEPRHGSGASVPPGPDGAGAAARSAEEAGRDAEQRALAAFREARGQWPDGTVPPWRRRGRDDWRPAQGRRGGIPVRAAIGGFAVAVTLGGAALAAGSGALPTPFGDGGPGGRAPVRPAHSASAPSSAGPESPRPGTPPPRTGATGPGPTGPTDSGRRAGGPGQAPDGAARAPGDTALCQVYERSRGIGRAGDPTALERLEKTAGGASEVAGHCEALLRRAADGTEGKAGAGSGARTGPKREPGPGAGREPAPKASGAARAGPADR
ncbi:hypothetical protein OHA98_14535 [Streptomyces sp. NBC_00654]|uniref:hypothetical protein n=1 Tax=Streptomyces sp. NBC_00654 TaxID=2975799 RepID=UPI00224E0486|nr:hypothetical protein [Streptomyces sp. NBC_00654]MCX4966039.1 hypothetical protein [Streptomyces sp. NBC_00654]